MFLFNKFKGLCAAHIGILVFITNYLSVSIAQGPKVIISPDINGQKKSIDTKLFLTCTVKTDGGTQVTFEWLDPTGEQIPENQVRNKRNIYTEQAKFGDQNGLALYIQKIQREHEGKYTCVATLPGGTQQRAEALLETYLKINFADCSSPQHVVVGTDGMIKCKVNANPPATIDWTLNDEALKNGGRITITPDGIRITDVKLDDEGTYVCRAKVFDTGDYDSKAIDFRVYVPPDFSERPAPYKAVEGEDAMFRCKAEGKPDPQYIWLDEKQANLSSEERFNVDKDGTLTIRKVDRNDAGQYRCIAVNDAGRKEAVTYLDVAIRPKIEQFENLTAETDTEATFICRASGMPLPDIKFRKLSSSLSFVSGVQPEDSRIIVEDATEENMKVAKLRITSVEREDDGLYACVANSSEGEGYQNGHLTVEFAPTFSEHIKTHYFSWSNNPVNLTCVAESIPNATISWWKNGRDIDDKSWGRKMANIKKHGEAGISILEILPLDDHYYGTYICKAVNKLGENELEIKLEEAFFPGSISQVILSKVTATTISFKFVPPQSNGGIDIDSYAVEYKRAEDPWESAKRKTFPLGAPYVLEDLMPKTHYQMRFAAHNLVGYGDWSRETTPAITKDITAPEKPIILAPKETEDAVVDSPYPHSYRLEWQIPADNGDPISHFELIYVQVEPNGRKYRDIGPVKSARVQSPGNVEYMLEHLRPDSYYRIQLAAHNSHGLSEQDEIIIKTKIDGRLSGHTEENYRVGNGFPSHPGSPFPPDDYLPPEEIHTGIIVGCIILILFLILLCVDIVFCVTKKIGLIHSLFKCLCDSSAKKTITTRPSNEAESEKMLSDKVKPEIKSGKIEYKSNDKGKPIFSAKDSVV